MVCPPYFVHDCSKKRIMKDRPSLQTLLGSKEHKTSLPTQHIYLLHTKILFGPYKPTAYIRGYPPPDLWKTTNRWTWCRLSTVSLHTHVVILSTGSEYYLNIPVLFQTQQGSVQNKFSWMTLKCEPCMLMQKASCCSFTHPRTSWNNRWTFRRKKSTERGEFFVDYKQRR